MLVSIIFITMSGLSVFAAESSVPETTPTLQEMKNYLLSIGTEQKFLDDINDSKNGFNEQVKEELRAINNGRKTDQVPHNNLKQRMELWQKYFDNGNYLRSAEMTEEQNYNMIDGRMNNLLQKKEKGKKKRSVLRRLYNKKCEVAKKLGRSLPRRYEILEKEKKF